MHIHALFAHVNTSYTETKNYYTVQQTRTFNKNNTFDETLAVGAKGFGLSVIRRY